jgi:hypothetical protein
MMYPFGGCGTDPSPGTFHYTTSVSGGSCPTAIRRCSIVRDTLDHDQFNMAMKNFRARLRRKRWRHCGHEERKQ